MGWDFTKGASKLDVVDEIVKGDESHVVKAHSLKGNVLWTVEKARKVDGEWSADFIGCYLIEAQRGYGYGHKDMCESMAPYYYSCPLCFLGMCFCQSPEWRDGVYAFHAREAAKANRKAQLKVGCKIRLTENCIIMGQKPTEPLTVVSLKPTIVHFGFYPVKVSPRHIAEILPD